MGQIMTMSSAIFCISLLVFMHFPEWLGEKSLLNDTSFYKKALVKYGFCENLPGCDKHCGRVIQDDGGRWRPYTGTSPGVETLN